MGFADVDRKATTPYVPAKFLKKLADRHGVNVSGVKSEEELRRLIDAAKKTKTDDEVKNGEIIPPLKNGHDRQQQHYAHGPQIVMNLPSLHANVNARLGPQWFDCVSAVQNAILYMVTGAALYAVVSKVFGL